MFSARDARLKAHLDRLYATYGAAFLDSDPLCFPRRYTRPDDREVVGLLAAVLAYGRVGQIQASTARLLAILGPRPAQFVRRLEPGKARGLLGGFVHRFNDARDLGLLLHFMRQMMSRSGSIEGFFLEAHSPAHDDIGPALSSFVRRALALDCSGWYPAGTLPAGAGVRFLLPSPEDGSTCKRLNMYLRWMVRADDGVDLGVWRGVSPARLVMPLDTHVSRLARTLRLTRRRTVDWRMAIEVTDRLRRLEPEDPVRYDFALSRLGIVEGCPTHHRMRGCTLCRVAPVGAPSDVAGTCHDAEGA